MPIHITEEHSRVLKRILPFMAEFRRVYGREARPDFIAEIYAAQKLGLTLLTGQNESGHDAVGADGSRYQIKLRNAPVVDLNNFNFDFLILVNLGEDYQLEGMWQISSTEAEKIFNKREKYNKFQATQSSIKKIARQIS